MTVLRYAARSHVGYVRAGKANQDAGYAGPNLLAVCDGMGGAAGGDVASSVAMAHLVHLDEVQRSDLLLDRLRAAAEDAHEDLIARSRRRPELSGMGTTCTAIVHEGNKLAMVHIGDSRAYLLHEGVLTQITTDHTLVNLLVQQGRITAEEAERHPKRNVIMRVLGDSEEPIELDESVRIAVPGDRWLLCSDGLSGVVSHETIAKTLIDYPDPEECADQLISLALRGGGPDNITCVVADILAATDLPRDELPSQTPQIVGSAAANPASRQAPPTAAGRAAALTDSPAEEEESDDAEDLPSHTRRWIPRIAIVTVLAAVLVITGWLSYGWLQRQYFVGIGDNDKVAVLSGVPWDLGPIPMSKVRYESAVNLAELNEPQRRAVQSGIRVETVADGIIYIDERLKHGSIFAPPKKPGDNNSDSPDGDTTGPIEVGPRGLPDGLPPLNGHLRPDWMPQRPPISTAPPAGDNHSDESGRR